MAECENPTNNGPGANTRMHLSAGMGASWYHHHRLVAQACGLRPCRRASGLAGRQRPGSLATWKVARTAASWTLAPPHLQGESRCAMREGANDATRLRNWGCGSAVRGGSECMVFLAHDRKLWETLRGQL